MSNFSSHIKELRELIAGSSSAAGPASAHFEAKLREVLPSLLRDHVLPSPTANERETTAVLKLLTYTARRFPGVFFNGRPAEVVRAIGRILPFFADPDYQSIIFDTVWSLLSLLRTGDREAYRQFFLDLMTAVEDLEYVASNHAESGCAVKCLSGSFSDILDSPAIFSELPDRFQPRNGPGVLVDLSGGTRWCPFATSLMRLINKCLTDGTLHVEGLLTMPFVSAAGSIICYGDESLHKVCFDFARIVATVTTVEILPMETIIRSITLILSKNVNELSIVRIITGHASGNVKIWNYDTQEYTGFIKTQEGLLGNLFDVPSVRCIKFITRMGWFVVGAGDVISVYNYKNMMQKVTSFKTNSTRQPLLAIHATQPYALSIGRKGVELWAWGRFGSKWKCMQVFKDQSDLVRILAFNPEDHDSFAGGCRDGTIKVWSIDSLKSKYTLSGHSGLVWCMEFFTRDGQQYLITGSDDETAKIWDMQMKECAHTLHHRSQVRSVLPHPTLSVLVTGTIDGLVYLWSSINFRLKRILKIDGRWCDRGLACLNESRRVVVAYLDGLSIIEISDEEEQGGSNYDTSVSATN